MLMNHLHRFLVATDVANVSDNNAPIHHYDVIDIFVETHQTDMTQLSDEKQQAYHRCSERVFRTKRSICLRRNYPCATKSLIHIDSIKWRYITELSIGRNPCLWSQKGANKHKVSSAHAINLILMCKNNRFLIRTTSFDNIIFSFS